jgi:predicted amidohydrolase
MILDGRRPRKVRIAAIQMLADKHSTKEQNIRNALALIDKAARHKPDLIVLPEAVPTLGCNGQHYREVAEPIPGPTTRQVSAKAKRHNCYIVFPLIEKNGKRIYNSAVIFGRRGQIVDIYHKIHEPEVVVKVERVRLGSSFPVYKLDFGKIGIMICWDNTFPETASILSLKGAEIILYPHLIGLPSQLNFNVTTRARAIDNCVYVVAAGIRGKLDGYSWYQEGIYPTCIIGRDGSILAQAERNDNQVIVHDLDLSAPRITKDLGILGETDWKRQYLRERRNKLYAGAYRALLQRKH